MIVLAIDPGPTESAYALIESQECRPLLFGKVPNDHLARSLLRHDVADIVAIEMVASYGMPVGADVFETCVWIGRFVESARPEPRLVYRHDIKLHHCGSVRAKDANIIQALIDRFAPSAPNKGKGTKAAPGWFYGFKTDIWQAYALAVYMVDRESP